jgi:hypothetical protein
MPEAARLLAAAEPLVADPVLLANCHRLRGSIELAAGTTTTVVAMLVTGAKRLTDVDPRRALELLALAAEGASLAPDAEAAREIARLAQSLDVGGDKHDEFFIGLLIGFAQQLVGDVGTGITTIRKALAAAEDEADDVDLMLAAGRAGFYVGDDAAAHRFHDRIVSRALDRIRRLPGDRRDPGRACGNAGRAVDGRGRDGRRDRAARAGHRAIRAGGARADLARTDRRLARRGGALP